MLRLCCEWNLSDRQKNFRCSGVCSDDAITRWMPRPSDTRLESDDESSDGDSDRDEIRRSRRDSSVEALSFAALKERGEVFLQNEGRAGCKPSAGA